MNFYFVCPREERSDVAIHLSTAFRGSPQSASLLRDDKFEFISGERGDEAIRLAESLRPRSLGSRQIRM